MKKFMGLIVIPLIIAVVGGIAVVLFERYLDKDPTISIRSEGDILIVTNNSEQVLHVRVAYGIVEQGSTTYCYPNPTLADGDEDPLVWPGDEVPFPPKHCNQNINGYKVWAWDASYEELVFEGDG